MNSKPTKMFGWHEPTDLLLKIKHDVARLHEATTSMAARSAALDCAIWTWHMVDLVLNFVTPEQYEKLTGKRRRDTGVSTDAFLLRNTDRLPHLKICQQLALNAKHYRLTHTPEDRSLGTEHRVVIDPPFSLADPHRPITMRVELRLTNDDGDSRSANEFFDGAMRTWAIFLQQEGLLGDRWWWDEMPDDFTGSMDEPDQ